MRYKPELFHCACNQSWQSKTLMYELHQLICFLMPVILMYMLACGPDSFACHAEMDCQINKKREYYLAVLELWRSLYFAQLAIAETLMITY